MSQTLLQGDPRAINTPDPAGDMNNVNDVLLGLGFLYNVQNTAWGADPTGTNDSTAGIQACTNAALTAGDPVSIPAGTYRVSSSTTGVPALNWKGDGLKVVSLGGSQNVKIRAYGATCNYPLVAVAGQNQSIGGLQIGYNSQQATSSTYAAPWQMGDDTVGNCFDCHYYDMEWFQGAYGSVINPNLTATGGFFSCQFDSCGVKCWSISSVFWDSAAGTGASNCTGSVFNNFYLNNLLGSQGTSSSYGVDIRQFDEIVFNQLNLEHCTINSTDWFNFQSSGAGAPMNVVLNSLHCEQLTLAGSGGNAGYFHIGQYVNLVVNGMSVFYATLNGTVNNPVVRFFGTNSNAEIHGFSEGTTNAFGGASPGVHPWVNYATETGCTVAVTSIAGTTLVTGLDINAGAGCVTSIGPPASQGVFGTGADGQVILDGTTSYAGFSSLAGSTYTLTRDVQAAELTVNSGVTVKTANYRIFCQNTLTNGGAIQNTGLNASGASAGGSGGSASLVGGRAGGGGGTGVSGAGAAGTGSNLGAAGGAGGAGTSGGAGSGGAVTQSAAIAQNNLLQNPSAVLTGLGAYGGVALAIGFGAGGGGGGSDASSNAGGGGGGGGGIVALFARSVVNTGTITVAGGNGASAAAGNAGGGGGGSGGLIAAYTLTAWTAGTATVTGGTLGNGHGSGSNGSTGGAGLAVNVVIT